MITGLAHQRSERSVLSDPLLAIAPTVMGKGMKSEDAENKQHFIRILCGDNFVMRRINTILDA